MKIEHQEYGTWEWWGLKERGRVLTRFEIYNPPRYHNFRAFKPDVLELMNFRSTEPRKGYGSTLLTHVMGIRKFMLCSYPEAEEFYEKMGLFRINHPKYHFTIFHNCEDI